MTRSRAQTFREAGQTLTLIDRGSHFELMLGRVPLLTSASLGTERDFGRLAADLAVSRAPRIVVGGLGFGATLGAVLDVMPAKATVLVVEKLETIVGLVRGALAHLAPGVLDDARVTLVRADVQAVIAREHALDAILLDVDNGPEWASFGSNRRLYQAPGLRAAHAALRPGGSYAVWSGYPADAFVGRLRAAGFAPRIIPFREKGRVRARAYVGTKARDTAPRPARARGS